MTFTIPQTTSIFISGVSLGLSIGVLLARWR